MTEEEYNIKIKKLYDCPYCNKKFDLWGINCHIGNRRSAEKRKNLKPIHFKNLKLVW